MKCENCKGKLKVIDTVTTDSETATRKIPDKFKYMGSDITYRNYKCLNCGSVAATLELKVLDAVRAPFVAVDRYKQTIKDFIEL